MAKSHPETGASRKHKEDSPRAIAAAKKRQAFASAYVALWFEGMQDESIIAREAAKASGFRGVNSHWKLMRDPDVHRRIAICKAARQAAEEALLQTTEVRARAALEVVAIDEDEDASGTSGGGAGDAQHPEILPPGPAPEIAMGEAPEVSRERVAEELACVAFANIADYIDLDREGNPTVNIGKATRRQLAAISEIAVETVIEGRGAMESTVRRVRFKLWPKQPALDALRDMLDGTGGGDLDTLIEAIKGAQGTALPIGSTTTSEGGLSRA